MLVAAQRARVARLGARRALEDRAGDGGLCELCFYYNDLYDLTVVHSRTELLVRVLRAAGTRRDRAGLAVVVRARRSASATASSSPRCGCCSSPSRLWRHGLRRPHTRSAPRGARAHRRHGTASRVSWPARSARSTTSRYRIVGFVDETGDADTDGLDLPLLGTAADVSLLVAAAPDRSHRRQPVGPARPAADPGAAAGQAVRRARRRRGDDLRADHRQDPDRRTSSRAG